MRRMTIGLAVAALSAAIAVPALAAPAGAAPSAGAAAKPAAAANAAAHAAAPRGTARTTADAPKAAAARPGSGATVAAYKTHQDGYCNLFPGGTGDLCLWYYQNYSGSVSDFYIGDPYLWDNPFISPGAGQGQTVANNAESDWNYDTIFTAWVCTSTGYTGYCGYIPPWSGGNFNYIYRNNVESLFWA